MAVDYGEKRIGLALTDPLHIIARPFLTLPNTGFADVSTALLETIATEHIGLLIIGLPLNHEGADTRQTGIVRRFAQRLREMIDIDVVFQDERFTTEEANRELKRLGLNPIEGRKIIDQIAATIILREYMEVTQT
jgi:putative Holliday junction resolvase